MSEKDMRKIALVGNPNCGKSSLFNQLTGLNQKVGNYPGVTVEKKTGFHRLQSGEKIQIIDLPGTYSLYSKSEDELVVSSILLNPSNKDYPDLVVVVVDASNLKRNLLLLTQLIDLDIPVLLALNMLDQADKNGIVIDHAQLEKSLGVPVVLINARIGQGIKSLSEAIGNYQHRTHAHIFENKKIKDEIVKSIGAKINTGNNAYLTSFLLQEYNQLLYLSDENKTLLQKISNDLALKPSVEQQQETQYRYDWIEGLLQTSVKKNEATSLNRFTKQIDKIILHPLWGYLVFLGVMALIFQAVFTLSEYPMDLIDRSFSQLSSWVGSLLPEGPFNSLLTEGLLPGIGGVVIFLPQIIFLFCLLALLEESGYMSRVMVLMDTFMRKFGLNGKSIIPLVSGVACAIPSIMSARTIGNKKERLITILVTPLISCSARLPIYTLLIGLVVPSHSIGIFNLQGLTLLGLYLLGFVTAIVVAWILHKLLKVNEQGFFVMEIPPYRAPRLKNVALTVYEKSTSFVFEAGKVIVAISIILWVMASYGPGDRMMNAENELLKNESIQSLSEEEINKKVAAARIENSYAGIFGKVIEPVIAPLGYDWKIGIALITSFAAREVFVGSISTIYSIGSEEETTIRERLETVVNSRTGKKMFDIPTSFSLLIYYAFAMQCMSTLAVVYKETKSWKWPLVQLVYLSALAYIAAWVTYITLN